jgi:hypothetical protein
VRTLGTLQSTRIALAVYATAGAFILFVLLAAAAAQAHQVGDWCVFNTPAGASEVGGSDSRPDWTWMPPGWDCVYSRRDRQQLPHDVARRRAFSE